MSRIKFQCNAIPSRLPSDLLAYVLNFCDLRTVFHLSICSQSSHESVKLVLPFLSPVCAFTYTKRSVKLLNALKSMRSCSLDIQLTWFHANILKTLPKNTTNLTLNLVTNYRGKRGWLKNIRLDLPRLVTLRGNVFFGETLTHLPLKSLCIQELPQALPLSLEELTIQILGCHQTTRMAILPRLPRLRSLTVDRIVSFLFFVHVIRSLNFMFCRAKAPATNTCAHV